MNKNLYQRKGFTIIEVVLVLAIAALIILMVFIAWPALQRTQRDQARKNDVSLISAAIGNWKTNHKGALPNHCELVGNLKSQGLNMYSPGDCAGSTVSGSDIKFIELSSGTSKANAVTSVDEIQYVRSAQCENDNSAKKASSRQAAILYAVEANGSTAQPQCQDA